MNEFVEKYGAACSAEMRYRNAPRRGWADPEVRKTKDNQTIEVPRKEAVELARSLASAMYGNWTRLYENLALRNYMDQIAEEEPGAVECPKCHCRYLPGWMGGQCPYCAAAESAAEKVQSLLEEGTTRQER